VEPILILKRLVLLAATLALAGCMTPRQDTPQDALLALYRNERLKPLVTEYYSRLTQDRSVAVAILETCDSLGINPSLAFAIAWNESHFDPRAVSYNSSTIDRGLFQLNSETFSQLDRKTVFDPRANALHGLTFYKMAYDKLGTEEKALGYYNSGIGLVSQRPYPRSTQIYIKRVMADRAQMDRDAIAWIYFSHDTSLALR
jgi:soluble lytic murein transglycosylase-like protein